MSTNDAGTLTDAGSPEGALSRSLTEDIVTALADAQDCRPEDLVPRLYDVIDPDALEALFAPRHDGTPRRGGHVVFAVEDHEVRVDSGGCVTVRTLD